jgi:hypothetical protein
MRWDGSASERATTLRVCFLAKVSNASQARIVSRARKVQLNQRNSRLYNSRTEHRGGYGLPAHPAAGFDDRIGGEPSDFAGRFNDRQKRIGCGKQRLAEPSRVAGLLAHALHGQYVPVCGRVGIGERQSHFPQCRRAIEALHYRAWVPRLLAEGHGADRLHQSSR